ncbi:hypothetical protein [Candidatus Palauibacter sp.]|uniref:hypothetical protein n=1 Tax=Candidatus Palauibacter sp. TaxID=3101350 RepID=UPI003B528DB5
MVDNLAWVVVWAVMLLFVVALIDEFVWHPLKDWQARRRRSLKRFDRYADFMVYYRKRVKQLEADGKLDKLARLEKKRDRLYRKAVGKNNATRQAARRQDATEAGPSAREEQDSGGRGAADDAD